MSCVGEVGGSRLKELGEHVPGRTEVDLHVHVSSVSPTLMQIEGFSECCQVRRTVFCVDNKYEVRMLIW